jgi:CRISPR type III-associated protein (TIGR04423 family)
MNRFINITDIPKDKNYEGYLWLSDAKEPQTDSFDKRLGITDTSNPFIVEGQLYSEEAKKSYSIKYIDGKHLITEYDLENIPDGWISEESDEKSFIPNRIKASRLLFRQYWKLQKDDLCEGMETLIPAAYVFVGFINNEKEDR